ncbi:unnamed protein product, partial [Cyprideis torosa]
MTGHLLGAAGGIEAVFSVLAIRDQVLPPTINLEEPDEGCDLDYVSAPSRVPSSEARLLMLVNGRAESTLPADDRGLLYGDGLFETVRVVEGGLRLWSRHIDRLKRGCESLRIELDFSFDELFEEASTLCRGQSGVLRVTVTRGSGPRGYRIPVMVKSTRVLQFSAGSNFAVPNGPDQGAAVTVCNMRLGRQPVLAGIKHLNRLEQVLARSEW